MNTVLVDVLGIVLATVVGVLAGVLRLPKNWIVARLMSIHVEGFRNIPLLLWILLIFAVLTDSTPQPRDFRIDPATGTSAASMLLWDSVAISNRGVYIPAPVLHPGAYAFFAVLTLSVLGAPRWRSYSRRMLFAHGIQFPVFWPMLWIVAVPAALANLLLDYPVRGAGHTGLSAGCRPAGYR